MFTQNEVNDFLISAVSEIKSVPEKSITIKNHILYDLYMDSVDLIELLAMVEGKFKVFFDDDQLDGVDTLESISALVIKYSV